MNDLKLGEFVKSVACDSDAFYAEIDDTPPFDLVAASFGESSSTVIRRKNLSEQHEESSLATDRRKHLANLFSAKPFDPVQRDGKLFGGTQVVAKFMNGDAFDFKVELLEQNCVEAFNEFRLSITRAFPKISSLIDDPPGAQGDHPGTGFSSDHDAATPISELSISIRLRQMALALGIETIEKFSLLSESDLKEVIDGLPNKATHNLGRLVDELSSYGVSLKR